MICGCHDTYKYPAGVLAWTKLGLGVRLVLDTCDFRAILASFQPSSLTQEESNWPGALTVDLLYQKLLYNRRL